MIKVQKIFPTMPDFNCNLPKYFVPCIELSCKYSCKSSRAIAFLIFIPDWLSSSFAWSNSLFIFFETSTWFTVIFFTMRCLCCEVFIMAQINWKTSFFSILFQFFLNVHCLQNTLYYPLDNASSTVYCLILLFDQNHVDLIT